LSEGRAGYVLPKHEDVVYLEIFKGELFGHIDLAHTKIFLKA
jgi:CRP-like cAMP-binding protein